MFIAAQLALLFAFNSDGWFGLLPAAATCVYTWFLDLKDAMQLKIVIIVTLLCWAVYDFVFKNYVTFAFDFGAVVSNLIGHRHAAESGKAGVIFSPLKRLNRTVISKAFFCLQDKQKKVFFA